MPKLFKKSSFQSIIAHSAMLVSVCAIVISVYEVKILEEQKHASVWPRVFAARNTLDEKHQVVVKNAGIGPAQIRSVEVKSLGQTVSNWNQAITRATGDEVFSRSKSQISHSILLPGEKITAVSVKGSTANKLSALNAGIVIKICYCSIYERCWVVDEATVEFGFPDPQEVDSCPADQATAFLN